jgi:hypothetical protein
MKIARILLLLLFIAFTSFLKAQTNETEPNNELASANSLPLDTEMSGQICMWNNEDWYQIVLPEDGAIQITVSSAGEAENPGSSLQFQLYSATGNPWNAFFPEAGNFGVMITDNSGWCCLKAGTFFIQVYTGYAFEYCYDYTVSVELEPATFGNDAEPNSNLSDNLATIPYNTTTEGHLSFISDPQNAGTDNYDHFKIVPPMNGLMRLIIESEAQSTGSNNLNVMMHNAAGNTWYQQSTSVGTFMSPNSDTLYWDCTPSDTLIAQFFTSNFFDRGYSYRFRYDMISPAFNNDIEPNNTQTTAQLIDIGTPAFGNQYYYGDNSDDVFKFFKPDTGFFKVRVTSSTNSSDGTLGTKVQVLDHNFNLLTQLNAPLGINGELAMDSLYFDDLPADTFFIRVNSDYAFAACRSYLLEFFYVDIADLVSEEFGSKVKIFPNPTSDYFVLDTRLVEDVSNVQITNALGEIIILQNLNGGKLHQIDCSHFAPGVYFVMVSHDRNRTIERVVIQR